MPSRVKRSLGRGLTEECQKFVERVRNSNGKTVKTHCRGMYVLPEMVGSTSESTMDRNSLTWR